MMVWGPDIARASQNRVARHNSEPARTVQQGGDAPATRSEHYGRED